MVNKYSVQQLNRLSEHREVWSWGCGFRFGLMVNNYYNETFMKRIVGLIDSNVNNQNKSRVINDKEIRIHAPNIIKNRDKKILLIISSDAIKEIYDVAKEKYKDMDIIYSVYPSIYYNKSRIIKNICSKLPLRRCMLFYVGSNNSQPHENAEAIRKYLNQEYEGRKYKIIYLTDYFCKVPIGVKQISLADVQKKASLCRIVQFYYWYAVSKYIMYESTSIDKYREGQIKIYLNHGTIPLKNVRDTLGQPEDITYAVCPGEGCSRFYFEQYLVPYEKLIFAMQPRVKELFIDACSLVNRVFASMNKQVILWLPTFRKIARKDNSERTDSSVPNPIIELLQSAMMKTIQETLRHNNQILIIKCHPREKEEFDKVRQYENVIISTDSELLVKGINTYQLMNRSDAMISDYSGVTFEYLFLDRPIGYYIPDFDSYSRGFSVDNVLDYMPGTRMRTAEDLIDYFNDLKESRDEFRSQRNELKENLFGNIDAANGARDLIHFLDGEK